MSESFFDPDDSLIEQATREKAEAAHLASEALEHVRAASRTLPEPEYERMRCWFEKLRDSAELWGYLTELYLRHRQVASSPVNPDRLETALSEPRRLDKLMEAARLALRKAIDMEHRHGSNSWPVFSPDRGDSAYEFIQEVLRNYIAGLTGEPAGSMVLSRYGETVVTEPVVEPGSIESLWRRLVELGRPRMDMDSTAEVQVHFPAKLDRIRILDTSMTLQARNGRTIVLPLSYPIREITLERDAVLDMRKHIRHVEVESRQPA
jgi:hypothetical protein